MQQAHQKQIAVAVRRFRDSMIDLRDQVVASVITDVLRNMQPPAAAAPEPILVPERRPGSRRVKPRSSDAIQQQIARAVETRNSRALPRLPAHLSGRKAGWFNEARRAIDAARAEIQRQPSTGTQARHSAEPKSGTERALVLNTVRSFQAGCCSTEVVLAVGAAGMPLSPLVVQRNLYALCVSGLCRKLPQKSADGLLRYAAVEA